MNKISKIILQTSKEKPTKELIDLILSYCPGYEYLHFTDDEIIEFFKNNPIDKFPNIIDRFQSFTKGQHKADLFRYYFLYLKGGVFLDSDAIFETKIENILKEYDGVFVKSFMEQEHLFNGLIAIPPKHKIMYEALFQAYYTHNDILIKDYHYLCQGLLKIFQRINPTNMKIYQEVWKLEDNYGGSMIVDDNHQKIASHYWQTKIIPFETNITKEFTKIYQNNFWIKGSGSGSYIENTFRYNAFVIDFIKNHHIQTVTDIGCGDWQSSYLIYQNVNIDYLGIDCVKSVIDENRKNYPKYKFLNFDILENLNQIPNSDLFILKDVLQHLKLQNIYKILDFLISRNFKYILITNYGQQKKDDQELDDYLGVGRGLNCNYLPLKKYNPIHIMDYNGGELKNVCLIQNNSI